MMPIGVAIVDDDPRFASTLVELLSLEPAMFVVGTAGTVSAGIALLADRRVRLAFVDVHMPDGGGLRVAEEVRRWRDPPTIELISANPPPADARRSGLAFISKQDLGPDALRRAVARATAR